MTAPIVRPFSLCAWMMNGPGLSICLGDGDNQRGLLSSGTRWGTPDAWHRTRPTAQPDPQPALAAAGGRRAGTLRVGQEPLAPAVAPLRAQGKELDVHRCSLSLGVISEVLHHPFVFDKVKRWGGGEQASRVLQGQLVEIHLPLPRHTALTPSHVLSFISQFPLQSPSREAVCAALGTRGMIC